MTTGSVLDILIYVFDRYMLDEAPPVPQRAQLARQLEHAGFEPRHVERALDWLTELACGQETAAPAAATGQPVGLRIYGDAEAARLSTACRGLLLTLERAQVLTAAQRELVIERLLALDSVELDTEQLKWVVLMVLSSQPGHELSIERLGGLVSDAHDRAPH